MPRTYRQSRRDANHTPIVNHARGLNISVLEVHSIGGALDLVCGFMGIDFRVEIKDGSKSASRRMLTQAEGDTMRDWKGRKPIIWDSLESVERTRNEIYNEAIR